MTTRAAKSVITSKGRDNQCEFAFQHRRQKNSPEFTLTTHLQESHGKIIYAVEFCNNLADGQPIIFATCGSNVVTIYECRNIDGGIKLLQCYQDSCPSESFYTLAWSFDSYSLQPILAVAGYNRIIRIIQPTTMTSDKHLLGHGLWINDLKFHPKNPNLLLSASRDESVRLWNIRTQLCVAIFKGINGHKCEVLSADFDSTGSRIATSGVDRSVMIWPVDGLAIRKAIKASFDGPNKFKPIIEHFPEYTVDGIHRKFVDCVKWMGELILSKSNENAIICWKPGCLMRDTPIVDDSTIASVIHRFEYTGDSFYFIRFGMDVRMTRMAVGNDRGTTSVWKMNGMEPGKAMHLRHPSCNSTVRATAFSRDANILISVCDDGSVWVWNREDNH